MVVFTVHTKCLKDRYLTSLCSTATLFVTIATVICVIFPFIVAYRSRGFWIKHDSFYEQPNVHYKKEYLFIATTTDDVPIICNNLIKNQQLIALDSCSVIKAREIDKNDDGKMDELYFKLSVNLPKRNLLVKALTVILTFDYRLRGDCPLEMQTASIMQVNNVLSNSLALFGDLKTSQSFPLPCYARGKDLSHNHSILIGYDKEQNVLQRIISNYGKRNITTHVNNMYLVWSSNEREKLEFTLDINLKITDQLIYYEPSFWQVIKWAWVQYFSIFVVFLLVFNIVKSYVFANHLVLFYKLPAIKEKIN